MTSSKKIFVTDDEKEIREIITINLKNEGYNVFAFSSADEALKSLTKNNPDLIILDIMMPGMDGYDFCKKLRSSPEWKEIPIIFLSAKSEEFDKILGLELGGDDYLTKPFSLKELKARVKAILRRSYPSQEKTDPKSFKKIVYQGLELNQDNFSLKVDGQEVVLTKTEFNILNLFLSNQNKVFSRDNIIDSIKGSDIYVIDRTIDVHIMNLRKKLGPYKKIIKTFSGIGYGFKAK